MIYTALGDSITYGQNASSLTKSYPHLTASALNTSARQVRVSVLARPGWTSSNLLRALVWRGSSAISRSSMVSVWIGGVDLANGALALLRSHKSIDVEQIAAGYSRNLSAIFTHIRKRSRARIVCCTQYNPFPNSPLAIEAIALFNGMVSNIAHHHDVTVVPTHRWFEGNQAELLDGYRNGKIEDALGGFMPIHPNDRGHRMIATGLSPYLIPRQ
ncbi:SGNH/GDSL hydrolase family protein [Paenibacillus sp. KN14-4R]|uniref:SGNH/GDSL hydrolase family protein n=1 Tax=Paenibacillus sp. KN14-4R TaxID=3445773 RepID=UPI003F9EE329